MANAYAGQSWIDPSRMAKRKPARAHALRSGSAPRGRVAQAMTFEEWQRVNAAKDATVARKRERAAKRQARTAKVYVGSAGLSDAVRERAIVGNVGSAD